MHGGNSDVARRQAGLQLKNCLASNDESTKSLYQERWAALDPVTRDHVKNNVLGALGSEHYRPSAAAQCIQYIAMVELPRGQWPNLLQVRDALTLIKTNFYSFESRFGFTFEGFTFSLVLYTVSSVRSWFPT